jgi:hypothetical protein
VRWGPASTNAAAASRQRWASSGDPSNGVFSETMTVAGTASGQAAWWKAVLVSTKLSAVDRS